MPSASVSLAPALAGLALGWVATMLPAGDAAKAFEYLFQKAELAKWIDWHKDF